MSDMGVRSFGSGGLTAGGPGSRDVVPFDADAGGSSCPVSGGGGGNSSGGDGDCLPGFCWGGGQIGGLPSPGPGISYCGGVVIMNGLFPPKCPEAPVG